MKKEQEKMVKKFKVILTKNITDSELVNGRYVKVSRKAGEHIEIEEGQLDPDMYIKEEDLKPIITMEEILQEKRSKFEAEFKAMREQLDSEREKQLRAIQTASEDRITKAKEEDERRQKTLDKLRNRDKE